MQREEIQHPPDVVVNGKVVKLEQFSSLKSTLSTAKFRKTSADEEGSANETSTSIFSTLRNKQRGAGKVEKAIKAALGSNDPDQ